MPGAPYRLYGLAVESPIALSCPQASPTTRADVRLRAGAPARFASARLALAIPPPTEDWFHARRLPDGTTYLRWSGLFEFLVSPDGRLIHYHRLRRASHESFNTYLLGQVLSFSLLSFGIEPLHATAVVVDGRAIAFFGDCGQGKSTLGAAFLARGFPVLTDDLLALEPRRVGWIAHPGPPRLKLFPTMAGKLLAGKAAGALLNPSTSKRIVPLDADEAARQAVPLHALYVLAPPAASAKRRPVRVRITPLSARQAFLAVIRAAFNLIQVDQRRLENQFRVATRLAAEVPVRRLAYPRELSAIGAVCDAVLADAAKAR